MIDNAQMMKNWLLALKNPAIAYPNYRRLDVERRTRQSDGTWAEWESIDQNKNYEVLDNLPELDTEYVPETQRPGALVDPLPFLRAGYWTGVHVAQLVPAEVLKSPAPKAGGPGMPGMPGMSMEDMGRKGGMGMNMAPNAMPGMPGMPGMGSAEMGMPGSSVNPEEMNFTKHEDPTLMLRSLDFTVDPNTTYQFRVRIVVINPNKDHTDVNPGVDTESKELLGPWSEPTDPVTVPADVATYAQAPEPTTRRDDLVSFQVIKWDPTTGQTVTKNDIAGPGEIVGESGSVQVPNADGEGAEVDQYRLQQPGRRPRHLRRPAEDSRHRCRAERLRGPRPGDGRRARRLGRDPEPGPRQGRRGPQGHGVRLQAGPGRLEQEARARAAVSDARRPG